VRQRAFYPSTSWRIDMLMNILIVVAIAAIVLHCIATLIGLVVMVKTWTY
jgi:hypothetical protein